MSTGIIERVSVTCADPTWHQDKPLKLGEFRRVRAEPDEPWANWSLDPFPHILRIGDAQVDGDGTEHVSAVWRSAKRRGGIESTSDRAVTFTCPKGPEHYALPIARVKLYRAFDRLTENGQSTVSLQQLKAINRGISGYYPMR